MWGGSSQGGRSERLQGNGGRLLQSMQTKEAQQGLKAASVHVFLLAAIRVYLDGQNGIYP